MIRDVAAKRYAEAAFEIAREQGKEEEWAQGLRLLAALSADPQAQAFLESARVPLEGKLELAERALEGAEPLVLNLARLLIQRGRISLGPQIAEAFQELWDESRGIAHAVVTTAVPLSDEEREAVARKLREITGKEVVLETRVDEGIIGGLVARIGDRLIDGSTRSKLLALKHKLAAGSL